MKRLFIVFLSLFFCKLLIAQVNLGDSTPKDPLMRTKPEVINFNNEFLLKDDMSYLCHIKKIMKLKSGYLINAQTKIDTFNVNFYIVSAKTSHSNKVQKIRPNQQYYLSVKKYLDFVISAGCMVYSNENIVIADKINHIAAPGYFYYLYISDNLDGLEYIDSDVVESRKKNFDLNRKHIDTLIVQFLNAISFSDNFENVKQYVDTNSVKKIFKNYCFPYGNRKKMRVRMAPDCFFFPRMKLMNWKSYGVNPNNLNELLSRILATDYRLPLEGNLLEKKCSILKREVLNISNDNIYTIRVYWEIEGAKDVYGIILSIKQFDEKFKIIAINTFIYQSF